MILKYKWYTRVNNTKICLRFDSDSYLHIRTLILPTIGKVQYEMINMNHEKHMFAKDEATMSQDDNHDIYGSKIKPKPFLPQLFLTFGIN